MIQKIKDNYLHDALEEPFALVDFSAIWCGPCARLSPVMESLSAKLEGKVAFYGVDVDENPLLSREYKVMSVPTLILFKKGQVTGSHIGFLPETQLEQWITSALA